ncbi:MAG: hypothetical protein JXB04_13045 [Kiritimatiellae bacterium]|nr:hypothetical protein [Kiritimatiellia bacterium]
MRRAFGVMMLTVVALSLVAAVAPALANPSAEAVPSAEEGILWIDRMDSTAKNDRGGRNSVYMQPPSRAGFSKATEYGHGEENSGLKILFDKKSEGGPRGDGGFCGYYTILKQGRDGYLDAAPYKYLTFWIRGEKGGENFKIGAADKMWEAMDDSVKSQEITAYLPAGKITTEWQQAVIPLGEWFIDWKFTHALSFCFEADLYEDGSAQGVIFLDDLAFVTEKP